MAATPTPPQVDASAAVLAKIIQVAEKKLACAVEITARVGRAPRRVVAYLDAEGKLYAVTSDQYDAPAKQWSELALGESLPDNIDDEPEAAAWRIASARQAAGGQGLDIELIDKARKDWAYGLLMAAVTWQRPSIKIRKRATASHRKFDPVTWKMLTSDLSTRQAAYQRAWTSVCQALVDNGIPAVPAGQGAPQMSVVIAGSSTFNDPNVSLDQVAYNTGRSRASVLEEVARALNSAPATFTRVPSAGQVLTPEALEDPEHGFGVPPAGLAPRHTAAPATPVPASTPAAPVVAPIAAPPTAAVTMSSRELFGGRLRDLLRGSGDPQDSDDDLGEQYTPADGVPAPVPAPPVPAAPSYPQRPAVEPIPGRHVSVPTGDSEADQFFTFPHQAGPSAPAPAAVVEPDDELPSFGQHTAPAWPTPVTITTDEPTHSAEAEDLPAFDGSFTAPAFDAVPATEQEPAFAAAAPEVPAFEPPAFESPAFDAPAFEPPAFDAPTPVAQPQIDLRSLEAELDGVDDDLPTLATDVNAGSYGDLQVTWPSEAPQTSPQPATPAFWPVSDAEGAAPGDDLPALAPALAAATYSAAPPQRTFEEHQPPARPTLPAPAPAETPHATYTAAPSLPSTAPASDPRAGAVLSKWADSVSSFLDADTQVFILDKLRRAAVEEVQTLEDVAAVASAATATAASRVVEVDGALRANQETLQRIQQDLDGCRAAHGEALRAHEERRRYAQEIRIDLVSAEREVAAEEAALEDLLSQVARAQVRTEAARAAVKATAEQIQVVDQELESVTGPAVQAAALAAEAFERDNYLPALRTVQAVSDRLQEARLRLEEAEREHREVTARAERARRLVETLQTAI